MKFAAVVTLGEDGGCAGKCCGRPSQGQFCWCRLRPKPYSNNWPSRFRFPLPLKAVSDGDGSMARGGTGGGERRVGRRFCAVYAILRWSLDGRERTGRGGWMTAVGEEGCDPQQPAGLVEVDC
ncbi:leucyl/phenylalanyl-tRNA--protein transferase [Striga asiatica]|uniref:Leucyl/phenylalanyl-tRNA--protein transferase n=1 Tax=Striga asiatica TaxID=4170 RepID=A0A5A7PZJ8_STRAF|nr:leucyl/phenylalanyl-tRNA--protein transferase [Striga asiatica]